MNEKTISKCPYCNKGFRQESIYCRYCGKLSHLLLLMTGPGLSMKSVVANYLHRVLKIGLIESAFLGPVLDSKGITDNGMRQLRRKRIIDVLEVYLSDRLPVILDAAFHRKSDRLNLFSLISNNYPNASVMMLFCFTKDKRIRELRRKEREVEYEAFELEPFSQKGASFSLREYEEPYDDVFPATNTKIPIIAFETGSFKLTLHNFNQESETGELMLKIEEMLIKGVATGRL